MMVEAINPINNAELKLAQILGDDYLVQAPQSSAGLTPAAEAIGSTKLSGNPFEDILAKAIDALEGVSRSEIYADQLVEKYLRGEAELHQVMVAQSKAGIMVQLAVTAINSAVTTFKEITQMQV